nr:phage minor tail protein [uncultured Mediterranean phage uvMED]
MTQARKFPNLCPSSRKYVPGVRPETKFEAQNGVTTFVSFGSRQVNARLELVFNNIPDDDAVGILNHYQLCLADDYVTFDANHGLGGMATGLLAAVPSGAGALRYRYDGPPEVTSVFPGVSSVSCGFIGYLFAG